MRRALLLALAIAACSDGTTSSFDGGVDGAAGGRDGAVGDLAPARPTFPSLKPHQGHVLQPMKLVTIVAQNDTLASELHAFAARLVGSAWWQAARQPYGLGSATNLDVLGPAITSDMTQDQMIAYVQARITAGIPGPDGHTLYLLFLPDGVKISGPLPFDAYHTPFPSSASTQGDGFAVVARGRPYGGGETQQQELERIASHEIIEAATDPTWTSWSLDAPPSPVWQGTPWQVYQIPGPIEAADLCEGSRFVAGNGDDYERFWSNEAAAAGGDPCLPATGATYFNATTPEAWYAVAAGQTVTVPVTGWATAATSDWLALAAVVETRGGWSAVDGNLLPMKGPRGQELAPCIGEGMNDGVTAQVTVTAPATAKSGDFAVIQIETYRVDPQACWPRLDGDQFHMWLFGVYTP